MRLSSPLGKQSARPGRAPSIRKRKGIDLAQVLADAEEYAASMGMVGFDAQKQLLNVIRDAERAPADLRAAAAAAIEREILNGDPSG